MLIGPDTTYLRWEVPLLIGPDTTFPRVGIAIAYMAGQLIYYKNQVRPGIRPSP